MATKTGNGSSNTINGTNNDDFIYGKGGQDLLFGLDGSDYIDAGIGDDVLFGGEGDDTLFGSKGSDTMDGGLGSDTFRGGKGRDTVDYSTFSSGVRAYLDANQSALAAAGDTYASVENVVGSAFNDQLQNSRGGYAYGGSGADALYGGGGFGSTQNGGVIRGDAGQDTLHMNYGNTVAWLQNGQGSDIISRFDEDFDMFFIELSDFGLGNSLDENEIRNSATISASGNHAQLIYETDAQKLWFDSNGDGAGGLVLIAEFENSNITDDNLGTNDFTYQV